MLEKVQVIHKARHVLSVSMPFFALRRLDNTKSGKFFSADHLFFHLFLLLPTYYVSPAFGSIPFPRCLLYCNRSTFAKQARCTCWTDTNVLYLTSTSTKFNGVSCMEQEDKNEQTNK